MKEFPSFEKKDSAEQSYLVEKHDPEMRAAKFVLDPQEYINQHRDTLQSEHPNESEHAVLAINEIFELESVILHSDFTELHPDLERFLQTSEEYDPVSVTVLFTWLKEAGYTKEQVRTWINIEQDSLSAAERMREGVFRIVLNQVFPEE